MQISFIISIVLGLLLAAIVYAVGTAITQFAQEDLIWGLVAVLVFVGVAFNGQYRGRL